MEYKSNTQAIVHDLIKNIESKVSPSKLSRVGSEQLIGDMIRRIHIDGLDASGSSIGEYSTKSMYVSLTAFVRQKGKVGKGHQLKNGTRPPIKGQRTLNARGKNSNSPKFKNGNPRKSRYFEEGYKEYHDEMGNGTEVNLTLTGNLANDFEMGKFNEQVFGLGFTSYGMKIYPGLETHFQTLIWSATKDEEQRVLNAVEDFIFKNL